MPKSHDATRAKASSDDPQLKRTLSLPMMVLYGLGTTIGAGIYALLGAVVARAGVYAPVSFLVASVLAGLSAMSFAELAARFPTSAGEARYVREGLRSPALALAVGGLVIFVGIVSSAAVSNGFAGYFHDLTGAPRTVTIAGLVILMFVVAAWGIGESVLTAGFMTLIEVGGLLLVIWVARDAPSAPADSAWQLVPPLEMPVWSGILAGSFLAFFAFIGFEDMVNVAEEVKNAPRVLPIAIGLTLAITLALYLTLAYAAVCVVPLAELAASDAPLALVFTRATGASGAPISIIALIATVNGALIQIIMAARVLYGLARQGLLPAPLGRVNPVTRTPLVATVAVAAAVMMLALPFETAPLARFTSLIALTVFAFVNLSLWRLKQRTPRVPGLFSVPRFVPLAGFCASAGFIGLEAVRLVLH